MYYDTLSIAWNIATPNHNEIARAIAIAKIDRSIKKFEKRVCISQERRATEDEFSKHGEYYAF